MIADGSCRLFTEEQDGYALWHDRTATELVNNATKDLPITEKASHFVLTAEKVLPDICPKSAKQCQIGRKLCVHRKVMIHGVVNLILPTNLNRWHLPPDLCASLRVIVMRNNYPPRL